MPKAINDFKTRTTLWIEDDGTAAVVHPTEETVNFTAQGKVANPSGGPPITLVPGYASEFALFLAGLQSTRPGPTVTTGERDVREQYSLPGEVNVAAGTSRKVVEWNGQGPGMMHITAAKDGVHRIKMAGLPSGALTGEVSLIEGGVERIVGGGNLDATDLFTKSMKAGEVFGLSLNKQGGDPKTEVAIEPQ